MSIFLLILSVVGLLVGPLLLRTAPEQDAWRGLLDGFTMVAVGGLAILHLLPEALVHGGMMAAVLAIIGAALPVVLERYAERAMAGIASAVLVSGLAPHAALEAAALSVVEPGFVIGIGVAVAAHRLPVGLVLFSMVERHHGQVLAWLSIMTLVAATMLGFFAGETVAHALPEHVMVGLQALVAGSLMHVAFAHRLHGSADDDVCSHDHHHHDHHHHDDHGHHHDHDHHHDHEHAHSHAHGHGHHDHEHEHGEDGHGHHDHGHDHHDHGHVHEHEHHHDHDAHGHDGHVHDHGEDGHAHGHVQEHDHEHHHHDHDHAHDHEHAHSHAHDHDHHHHHGHDHGHGHGHHHHHHAPTAATRWSAMGAIGGAVVVAVALGSTPEHGHEGDSASLLETFWELALESAPALLIAYLLAGLIGVFITPARAQWLSGGSRPSQALRGVTFGLPMPVCSCGVLPLYESLVRRGVPATAAMGFLIATPELGLDALLLSIPLLGSTLTVARLVAAFAVAIVVAVVVGRIAPELRPNVEEEHHHEDTRPIIERVREGLNFGLVELFDHTMPWVIAGLIIAALAEPLLAHAIFTEMPSWLQVPLFAVIGVPIYVCASGATPIAAIAIHKGISAGAALAFLLAGPATNITTFGILSKLHGRRTALLFGLSVAICAIGAGWTVDWLMLEATGDVHAHAHHEHSTLQVFSLGVLTMLFVVSLFRQGPRGVMHQITQPIH